MGAWKSSDGGSIRVLGASSVQGDYVANTTLIAAGVNVKGITLRTASLLSAGGSAWGHLEIGGAMVLALSIGEGVEMASEIFIPAGKEIALVRVAGTIRAGLTYDIH